jgi:putative integral membrane protein (TIGR02587 family)
MSDGIREAGRRVGTDLVRGVAGGMILGVPLLYTMEMWWIGMYVSDWKIAGALLTALAVNVGLNHASGFAEEHDFRSDLRHGVIALGASAGIALVVLVLIRAVPGGYSFSGSVGKVALAAIPVSLGFSIANTQFGGGGRLEEKQPHDEDPEMARAKADMLDAGINLAGAILFVFAVAPTEEILLIASRTTGWHWAGLVVFSLLLSYGIVFVADFSGSRQLMDISLDGPMDGIEAAEAIRRQHDVPVIYLTAHSDPATLARAKITGPFGYILKPFDERDLATQIELALYKHQADRQLRQQREWLRVTLTSIGDAVIATDAEGRITFVNPVAEALTGWKAEEAAGQPIQCVFRIVNEQTGTPLEEPVARVLREGRAVELANHAALLTKDGARCPSRTAPRRSWTLPAR